MTYYHFWVLSVSFLVFFSVVAVVLMLKRYRGNKLLTPLNSMVVGVALSAMSLFFPLHRYCIEQAADNEALSVKFASIGSALLLSFQHTLRLFALEGDYYEFFLAVIKEIYAEIANSEYVGPDFPRVMYVILGSVLYVLAPVLTFAAVLLFFKNIWAILRYHISFAREKYVFSELNPKSLAFAKSIVKAKADKYREDAKKRWYYHVSKWIFGIFVKSHSPKEANDLMGEANLEHRRAWVADEHCSELLFEADRIILQIDRACEKKNVASNKKVLEIGTKLKETCKKYNTLLENHSISLDLDSKEVPNHTQEVRKRQTKLFGLLGELEQVAKYDNDLEEQIGSLTDRLQHTQDTHKSQEMRNLCDEAKKSRGTCAKKMARLCGCIETECGDYVERLKNYLKISKEMRDSYLKSAKQKKQRQAVAIVEFCGEIDWRCDRLLQTNGDVIAKMSEVANMLSDQMLRDGLNKSGESLVRNVQNEFDECFVAPPADQKFTFVNAAYVHSLAEKLALSLEAVQNASEKSSDYFVANVALDLALPEIERLIIALEEHLPKVLAKSEKYENKAIEKATRSRICTDKRKQYGKVTDAPFDRFVNSRTYRVWPLFGICIVFTDVLEKHEEEHYDLVEEAKELGAILFRKDLESIKFTRGESRNPKNKLNFYLISEDESEKLRHATSIMKAYPYSHVTLHVFSETDSSKMLLGVKNELYPKVIRIHDHQSLIYHNLHKNGHMIFSQAKKNSEDSAENHTIKAIVVGLGKYGMEMLKALAWYCQVPGYSIELYGFDSAKHVDKHLMAECPGLRVYGHSPFDDISKQVSEKCPDLPPVKSDEYDPLPTDPYSERYRIHIYSEIDVSSMDFFNVLDEIEKPTYVFVCLGSDEANIAASVSIREFFAKKYPQDNDNTVPEIETVVYDSNLNSRMGAPWDVQGSGADRTGCMNYSEQKYNIHMIGSTEEFYDIQTLTDNQLTQGGLAIHRDYAGMKGTVPEEIEDVTDKSGKQPKKGRRKKLFKKLQRQYDLQNQDFWKYEYNYRSSLAQAMFNDLLADLDAKSLAVVPIKRGKGPELTAKDRQDFRKIEHVRWMVYMKTEGYTHHVTKNALGKQHSDMIPAEERYGESKSQGGRQI